MPTINASSALETPTPVDALASFRSEIDALSPNEVLVPRVDVAAAALVAIGAMPEIEALRAQVVARFGEAAGRTLDLLVPLAQLLLIAQARFIAVAERDLEPMAREVVDARAALVNAASALVERGVIEQLPGLMGGQSYQARVLDVFGLVTFFTENAAIVAPHTKVREPQLDAAFAMANEFAKAFAARDQARAGTSAPARDRARVFTLFFRTYERVRKMLTFLRWHERDIDRVAPSIYAGRGGRKSDDVAAPQPQQPQPTQPVSPGMPGGDPFQT